MRILLTLIATVATFVLGAALAGVAAADQPPAPPGKDPCSHGNTGKPCKPDPQPDKGKDCEHHGKQGGVNEDHCKGEDTTTTDTTDTTTTETTATTQTETTSTTPTQPTTPGTTPTPTTPAAPVAPPAVIPPKAKPPVTKKELEKDLDEQAKDNGAPGAPPRVDRPGELPNTGLPLGLVALFGAALTASGWALRRS